MAIERSFDYEQGMDNYPLYRHVLYEPSAWYGDMPAFPGLTNSLKSGNFTNAEVSTIPHLSNTLLC
jgi:hypothetical protein